MGLSLCVCVCLVGATLHLLQTSESLPIFREIIKIWKFRYKKNWFWSKFEGSPVKFGALNSFPSQSRNMSGRPQIPKNNFFWTLMQLWAMFLQILDRYCSHIETIWPQRTPYYHPSTCQILGPCCTIFFWKKLQIRRLPIFYPKKKSPGPLHY